MGKHGKKYKKAVEALGGKHIFALQEGLTKVKELSYARFDESVNVHVNLGINPDKGDQVIRGSVLLPVALGKAVRILVFAKDDYADAAKRAGADYVGVEDLLEKIESGWMDFDYAIATPDLMGLVGKVAKILGPHGLLPNKKIGTVTFDVAHVISDLKKGRSFFKNDKQGIVHFRFGKVSFSTDQLKENFLAFIKNLIAAKPAAAKGDYIKKVVVASTMGIGIQINLGDW